MGLTAKVQLPPSNTLTQSQQLNTPLGSTQQPQHQQTLISTANKGMDIFGGLSLNSASTIKTQQQQPQQANPLFAGLSLQPKATGMQHQPQQYEKQQDMYGSQSNGSSKQNISQSQYANPYSKQALGEFTPPSFLQGPAFQTPSNLIENTIQSQKHYLSKDDPFYGLTFNPAPTVLATQQTNQNASSSPGSIFQFLQPASNTANTQPQQKTATNSEQKEIGNLSVSSINNISKNSFEEVEKTENIQSSSNNYYLAKPPTMSTTQSQQHQSAEGNNASNSNFYFLKPSSSNTIAQQPQNLMSSQMVNTSGGIGNFEIEKDLKDDNFEEITESKEIIEDRIHRIKNVMIDYTMKQQDLSEKIQNLTKDIELLQLKLEDTQGQQQRAIENEDYDEADQLNMRITQARNLIQSKESMIKKFDDDHMSLENKKSDKFRELSTLIHRSIEKMNELKAKQQEEMAQFEESEQNAIEEKKKRLHYESIRIEEIKKEINERKNKVNQKLQLIEEQVYEDTRPQQLEKQATEKKIEKIEKEIEEIEAMLERKKKERDQFLIEKQNQEKEIDKSRAKFRDQIMKFEKSLDKVQKDEDKNQKDLDEQKRELIDLQEYEETYKTRLEGFHKELKELEEFEKQLKKNSEQIDSTLQEKESCKDKAFMIKQEINQLKIRRDNAVANKEYVGEKQAKIDAEVEDLQHQISNFEKKISKLEQEKKKAAAQKKFKEASKAQGEIKEHTSTMEEAQSKLQGLMEEKETIEKEVAKKDEEIGEYDRILKDNQVQYEKQQLKALSYRKEDILDLLQSLKNMHNVNNAKKKTESLENELLKIDSELFELEKKYGEFKIKKQYSPDKSPSTHNKSLEDQQIEENMPEAESSSIQQQQVQDIIVDKDEVKSQEEVLEDHKEEDLQAKRSKKDIRKEIAELEKKVTDLEALIDKAAEEEDYEKADQYQTDIDNIKDQQIVKLQQELLTAIDDDEGGQVDEANQEEDRQKDDQEIYSPPSLGIEFNEEPQATTKDQEVQQREFSEEKKQEPEDQQQQTNSQLREEERNSPVQQIDDDNKEQQINTDNKVEVQQETLEESNHPKNDEQETIQEENAASNEQQQKELQGQEEERPADGEYQPPMALFSGMQLK